MRYIFKPTPQHHDLRTVKTFLWLPRGIKDEVRWLEKATIQQRYHKRKIGERYTRSYWEDLRFIDIKTA